MKITTIFYAVVSIYLFILFIYPFSPTSSLLEEYALHNSKIALGDKRLDKKHEDFIYTLADELQVSRANLIIRAMNAQATRQMGYTNAFVMPLLIANVLPVSEKYVCYVSSGFFEDLPAEQQRFLIGHELIHVKHKDVAWSLWLSMFCSLCSILIIFCSTKYIFYSCFHKLFSKRVANVCIALCVVVLYALSFMLSTKQFNSHRCSFEKRADVQSARRLNVAQAGVELFDSWKDGAFMQGDVALSFLLKYIYRSHPPLQKRIDYLKEIQKEQTSRKQQL